MPATGSRGPASGVDYCERGFTGRGHGPLLQVTQRVAIPDPRRG